MTIEEYFFSSLDAATIERVLLGAILCNTEMELTEDEKAIARQNIGAGREDRNFVILGYFDTEAELPLFPVTGDAYGVATSNYSYDVIVPGSWVNPSAMGYYILVDGEYVLTTDTTVVSGTVYYKRTPQYDIYIWDGVHSEWVNNGPFNSSAELIADDSNDVYHTLSSSKILRLFETFQIDANAIPDNCISASKIQNGAVSHVFSASVSGTWYGKVIVQKLSPNGTDKDYTLNETPDRLLKVEFKSAGLILTEGTDYTYSNGVLHFMSVPAAGVETYEISYHTSNPPYTLEVSVPGLLATDTPVIDIVPDANNYELAQTQLHGWAEIYKMVAENNVLRVYSHYRISGSLPIKILCVRK